MPNTEHECGTCGKEFPSGWRARDQHCKSTGHSPPKFECDQCHRYFGSESARVQHMADRYHFVFRECHLCDDLYSTDEWLQKHQREEHMYCDDCDRTFQNDNALKMHLRSRVHMGATFKCFFCPRSFVNATGVAHHLETGACASAPTLNRETIYKMLRERDRTGLITKNLIEYPQSTTYTPTERTWNGSKYECYFCHREFGKLQHLTQHLNSPAHKQNLYHCPNRVCATEFKSLASVVNHLEAESCGFLRFSDVQAKLNQLVNSTRLLSF